MLTLAFIVEKALSGSGTIEAGAALSFNDNSWHAFRLNHVIDAKKTRADGFRERVEVRREAGW